MAQLWKRLYHSLFKGSTAIGLDVEQTVVVALHIIAVYRTGVPFRFPL